MPTHKTSFSGQVDIYITVDELNLPDGPPRYIGYWSLREPGLINGESVKAKGSKRRIETFKTEPDAQRAAAAAAQQALAAKKPAAKKPAAKKPAARKP